ncbi:hypothetical protein [Fulvimonas yonginensis]|uniref:Phage tail protein n=1 Tax=Fulvimonas yonginensis TaxID=1495200 RepID=A0ABU8JA79_9GAMM
MGYVADALPLWPVPANWIEAVRETLAWLTDVQTARNGTQQKRQLRLAPRRAFQFLVTAGGADRRLLDALRFTQGVRQWLLPIYPDVQLLASEVAAGAMTIACRTAGFDFVAGGQAVVWLSATRWELLSIDTVDAGGLMLLTATQSSWPMGARLYPVRKARMVEPAKETQRSDDVGKVSVQLLIDEPCDWPAAWPSAAIYRGVPVLEWRSDESQDPEEQYVRTYQTVDEETGPVSYFDLPGMPFRTQAHRWALDGRDQQAVFRSLLYQLAGRAGQLWVPSWRADLQLAQAADGSDTLTVDWCGNTLFGQMQPNRRDIRIELYGGTVLYRRVTASIELGDTEQLLLDAPVGMSVEPAAVRAISFLSMCQLASDTVEINHLTDADGAALASTSWQAVRNDV